MEIEANQRSALVNAVLGYGSLIQGASNRSAKIREESLKRIPEFEEALITALQTSKIGGLQSVFNFDTAGKNIDPLVLRGLCFIAHCEIEGAPFDVAFTAKAIAMSGHPTEVIAAREALYRLCVCKRLVLQQTYSGEMLHPGEGLMKFIQPSKIPLHFDANAIRQAQRAEEIAKYRRSPVLLASRVKSAQSLYDELSRYVHGQHELKKALAVAGYVTLLRRESLRMGETKRLPPKSNVLVAGASGSGKTFACETLSRILGLPFATYDLSSATPSGYVGDDVSGSLFLLAESAHKMGVSPEDGGVLWLDEVDKLSTHHFASPTTIGTQFELLKLLDGSTEVSFPSNGLNKWGGSSATMNTANLLIITGGAFSWLTPSPKEKSQIGFGESEIDCSTVDFRDQLLQHGGLVPELLNRFTAVVRNQSLTAEEIASIVRGEHGALANYRATFEAAGRTINIEDDAALAIGQWSLRNGLQGRGAKTALESILRESLFTGAPKNLVVTREMVEATLGTKRVPCGV